MKRILLMLSLTLVAAVGAASISAQTQSAFIFRNVRIWDGRSDDARIGEVLVVGNKIEAVSTRIATPIGPKAIVIEVGAYADILHMNGDPLKDISTLEKPRIGEGSDSSLLSLIGNLQMR